MKTKFHIALVLITTAVACSANVHNELAQYIIDDKIAKFSTTIKAFSREGKLDLASPCDEHKNTLLHLAVQKGSLRFVEELMKYIGANVDRYVYLQNRDGWNPLQVAVHTWELDLLKYLIKRKVVLAKRTSKTKHY